MGYLEGAGEGGKMKKRKDRGGIRCGSGGREEGGMKRRDEGLGVEVRGTCHNHTFA